MCIPLFQQTENQLIGVIHLPAGVLFNIQGLSRISKLDLFLIEPAFHFQVHGFDVLHIQSPGNSLIPVENLDIQRKIVESVKIYHQIHCLRIIPIDFRDQINGTLQFVR